ncbi:hypothetical protein ACFL4J_01055 [Candidatus Margulisiibacteriota bacterium]
MLKQPFIFFSVLLLIFSLPAVAQNKDLTINADNVSFDRENNIVEAAGSVEVVYRDVTILGNYLVYNTELNKAWADRGFILSYGDVSIEGETLEYEIKTKAGSATDVSFDYLGIELSGKRIELKAEEFELGDASFTTCDIGQPHYRVTAADINFYPKYGWLVAYWGYFWLGPFPVVPMPTYIYDMRAEERARRNIPPFPEIGSNDEDGTYVNERLAWHIRRELSGSYSITYATKKGLGGGVEADYIHHEDSQGNARFYYNGTDGPFGGITHSLFFGQEVAGDSNAPFAFLTLPKQRQYQFDTTFSYHERINYERVSFFPNLVLKSRAGKILLDEANLDLELTAGLVSEMATARLARGGGKLEFYWDFPEAFFGDLTPALGVDGRYYSNGTRWVKTTGGLGLTKVFPQQVVLGLGYLHYFSVEGVSPFNFEMYRFNSADRLTSDLSFMVGETGVGVSTSHFFATGQPEDIDYSLLFKMHCYNLLVKYRSLRREFQLGFSLSGVN